MSQDSARRYQMFEETENNINQELGIIKSNAHNVIEQLVMYLESSKQNQKEIDDIYFTSLQELEESFLYLVGQFRNKYNEHKTSYQQKYDEKKLNLINEMNKTQRYISEISQIEGIDGSQSFMLVQKSLKNLNKISEEIKIFYNQSHIQAFQLETVNVDAIFMQVLQSLLFNSIDQRPKSRSFVEKYQKQRSLSSSFLQSAPSFLNQTKSSCDMKIDEVVESNQSLNQQDETNKKCISSPLEKLPEEQVEEDKQKNEIQHQEKPSKQQNVNIGKQKQKSPSFLLKSSKLKQSKISEDQQKEEAKKQIKQHSKQNSFSKSHSQLLSSQQSSKNTSIQSIQMTPNNKKNQKLNSQKTPDKEKQEQKQDKVNQGSRMNEQKQQSSPNQSILYRINNKMQSPSSLKKLQGKKNIKNSQKYVKGSFSKSPHRPKQHTEPQKEILETHEIDEEQIQLESSIQINVEAQTLNTDESTANKIKGLQTNETDQTTIEQSGITANVCSSEGLKQQPMSSKRIKIGITNPDSFSMSKDYSRDNIESQKLQDSYRRRITWCGGGEMGQHIPSLNTSQSHQYPNHSYNSSAIKFEDNLHSLNNSPAMNPFNKIKKIFSKKNIERCQSELRENRRETENEGLQSFIQDEIRESEDQQNIKQQNLFNPSPYLSGLNTFQLENDVYTHSLAHPEQNDQCELQGTPQTIFTQGYLNALNQLNNMNTVESIVPDSKSATMLSQNEGFLFKKSIQESVRKAQVPKQSLQMTNNSIVQSTFSNKFNGTEDLTQKFKNLEDDTQTFLNNNTSPISHLTQNDLHFFTNQNIEISNVNNQTAEHPFNTSISSGNTIQNIDKAIQRIEANLKRVNLSQQGQNCYSDTKNNYNQFDKNNQFNQTQFIKNFNIITRPSNQIGSFYKKDNSQNQHTHSPSLDNKDSYYNNNTIQQHQMNIFQQNQRYRSLSQSPLTSQQPMFDYSNNHYNNYPQIDDSTQKSITEANFDYKPELNQNTQPYLHTPIKQRKSIEENKFLYENLSQNSNQLSYSQKQTSSPPESFVSDSLQMQTNEFYQFGNTQTQNIRHPSINSQQQQQSLLSTLVDFIPKPSQLEIEFENSINNIHNINNGTSTQNIQSIIQENGISNKFIKPNKKFNNSNNKFQNDLNDLQNIAYKEGIPNNKQQYLQLDHLQDENIPEENPQLSPGTIHEEQEEECTCEQVSVNDNNQQMMEIISVQNSLKSSFLQQNQQNGSGNIALSSNPSQYDNSRKQIPQNVFTTTNSQRSSEARLTPPNSFYNQSEQNQIQQQNEQNYNKHPMVKCSPQYQNQKSLSNSSQQLDVESNHQQKSGAFSQRSQEEKEGNQQPGQCIKAQSLHSLPPSNNTKHIKKSSFDTFQANGTYQRNEQKVVVTQPLNFNYQIPQQPKQNVVQNSIIKKSTEFNNQNQPNQTNVMQVRARSLSECSQRIDYRINYPSGEMQQESEPIKKSFLSRSNSNGQLISMEKGTERGMSQRQISMTFNGSNANFLFGNEDSCNLSSNNQSAHFGVCKILKESIDQKLKYSDISNNIQLKVNSSSHSTASHNTAIATQYYPNIPFQNNVSRIRMTNQSNRQKDNNDTNKFVSSIPPDDLLQAQQSANTNSTEQAIQQINSVGVQQDRDNIQNQLLHDKQLFNQSETIPVRKYLLAKKSSDPSNANGMYPAHQILILKQQQQGENNQIRHKMNSMNAKSNSQSTSPQMIPQKIQSNTMNNTSNSCPITQTNTSLLNSLNSLKSTQNTTSNCTFFNGIIFQFGGVYSESIGEVLNDHGEKLGNIHFNIPQNLEMQDPGYFGFSCVMKPQDKSILFIGGYFAEKKEEKNHSREIQSSLSKQTCQPSYKRVYSTEIVQYSIEQNSFSVLNCKLHRTFSEAFTFYMEKSNKVVVIGGRDENNDVLQDCVILNLDGFQLEQKQSLPLPISGFCCNYDSRKGCLYLLGGILANKPLNTVYRMKLEDEDSQGASSKHSDEWQQLPSMINCRVGAQCKVLKKNLYIFGGFDGRLYLNSVEMYNFDLNKWFIVSFMKVPRAFYSLVCDSDRVIILGGKASSQIIANNIEVYDISKD